MKKFLCILTGLLILCGGLTAETQDNLLHPAKIGVTAGTGMRIHTELPYLLPEDTWTGLIFHIVPAIALRPGFVFYKLAGTDSDILTPASSTTADNGGLGVALGAFYFSRPKGNFMLYLGPEVKFYFSSEIDYYDNGDKKSDTSIKQLTAAALIGAQFMLSDRFGFHADAGLGLLRYFKHQRTWSAVGVATKDQEYDETTFFIRPAYFGAVFYFN